MVLYEQEEAVWRVKIKTKQGKIDLPLTARDLEPAVLEAEYLYADARAIDQGHPRCINCLHWLLVKAECGLGLPEGRSTGGEWAKDCACFWDKDEKYLTLEE
tara:strand:+ start:792 stop:1097 length:306 start_codon:yes stop_codon:yes gene_type:complete